MTEDFSKCLAALSRVPTQVDFDNLLRRQLETIVPLVGACRCNEIEDFYSVASHWRTIGHWLQTIGVAGELIDYFEHGQRVMLREIQSELFIVQSCREIHKSLQVKWTWRLCTMLINLVARRELDKNLPSVAFAIVRSVDAAREFAGLLYAIDCEAAEPATSVA